MITSQRLTSSNEAFGRLLSNLKTGLENVDATERKKYFEQHINSKRTFSQIRSVFDLIEVLVRLDVICEECVDVLKTLVPEQRELIQCYEKLHIDKKNCNICDLRLDTDAIPIPEPEKATAPSIIEDTKDDDTQEFNQVSRYISELLGGDKWVDLARKLNVKEYEINNIKANHQFNCTERANQMLCGWREVNGTDATKEKLLDALSRGANIRRDIVVDIQKGRHKTF